MKHGFYSKKILYFLATLSPTSPADVDRGLDPDRPPALKEARTERDIDTEQRKSSSLPERHLTRAILSIEPPLSLFTVRRSSKDSVRFLVMDLPKGRQFCARSWYFLGCDIWKTLRKLLRQRS